MRSIGVRWWDWAIAAGVGVLILGLAVHFWSAWALGLFLYAFILYLYFNWRAISISRGAARLVQKAGPADQSVGGSKH